MPEVTVRILKVYSYRTARVCGPRLPRSVLQFVQDEVPVQTEHAKDNHQLVVADVRERFGGDRVAILFHDSHAIVGEPEDVVVEDW